MLEITANQQAVQLYPDTSISMKLLSPVFNELGNHSLDFETPREGNEQVFDYPHRINKKSLPAKNLPMRLTHGSFSMEGLLSIMNASSTYRHFIKTGISTLVDTLRNTMLRDLVFETQELGTINSEVFASLNTILDEEFPECGYTFPVIRDASFYGEGEESLNTQYEGFLNNYYAGQLVENLIVPGQPTNLNTVCPQPFAWKVLEAIFKFIGYSHDNVFLRTESLKRVMFLNTRSMDFKEKKYVVNAQINNYQAIVNEERIRFTLTSPAPLEDETGCWDSSLYRYEIMHIGTHHLRYELLLTSENVVSAPSECLATIFVYKENQAGTTQETVHSQVFKSPTFNQFAIEKNISFTAVASDVGKYIYLYGEFYNDNDGTNELIVSGKLFLRNGSFLAWNQLQRSLCLSDYLPDVSCMDFLNAVQDTIACKFFYDPERKNVVTKFLGELLDTSPKANIPSVEPNPEITVEEEQGFTFSFSYDGADSYPATLENIEDYEYYGTYQKLQLAPWPTKENQYIRITGTAEIYLSYADEDDEGFLKWGIAGHTFEDLEIGAKTITISPQAGPVLMGSESYKGAGFACTKIEQLGFSRAYATGDQPCGLRFMLWLGKDPTSGKPLASCTGYLGNGERLTDFSLDWDGEHGLYNTFWKRWAEWRMYMAKQVSFKVPLPRDEYYLLQKLGFDSPVVVSGHLYLLESIEFVLMIDKICQLIVKGWRV